jgi:DUF1680 family protein
MSDDGLWVHHYGGNVLDTELADGRRIRMTQTTDYPWGGNVTLKMDDVEPGDPFAMMLRIPGWTKGAQIRLNDQKLQADGQPQTYAVLKRNWQQGDVIELTLPMPVRMMVADPRVEQVRNQVAVMRGPIVYCLESIDLPDDVAIEEVHLSRNAEWNVRHEPDLLRGVTVLETEAYVSPRTDPAGPLYQELPPGEPRRVPIRLIPYYAWNNRGEPKMTVWLPLY